MIPAKFCKTANRYSLSLTPPSKLYHSSTQDSSSDGSIISLEQELLIKNNQLLSHLVTRSDQLYNLKELLDSNYIREENGRYLMTVDVTKALGDRQ